MATAAHNYGVVGQGEFLEGPDPLDPYTAQEFNDLLVRGEADSSFSAYVSE